MTLPTKSVAVATTANKKKRRNEEVAMTFKCLCLLPNVKRFLSDESGSSSEPDFGLSRHGGVREESEGDIYIKVKMRSNYDSHEHNAFNPS